MDRADGYGKWNVPGGGGDVFCVDFLTSNESQNGLYLYVHWGLSLPDTNSVNNPWMDEALATPDLNMAPGVPSTADWSNATQATRNYYYYTTGQAQILPLEFSFTLPVSWDGTQAVGDGTWSAKYAPVPEPAAGEEIAAAVALLCGILYQRRIRIRRSQA